MEEFARIVVGYHGCARTLANDLLTARLPINQWDRSQNAYDWLGEGIYFWEHSPKRALRWATDRSVSFKRAGKPLPVNRGKDLKLRELDCAVINYCVFRMGLRHISIDTVRGAFLEGAPVFPGTTISAETHIQIAVRNVDCVLGVFQPNL